MDIVEILIVVLIFTALFPTISEMFLHPTTNSTPYPALYMTIFSIIPLLIVIGLMYYIWSGAQSGKKHGGIM